MCARGSGRAGCFAERAAAGRWRRRVHVLHLSELARGQRLGESRRASIANLVFEQAARRAVACGGRGGRAGVSVHVRAREKASGWRCRAGSGGAAAAAAGGCAGRRQRSRRAHLSCVSPALIFSSAPRMTLRSPSSASLRAASIAASMVPASHVVPPSGCACAAPAQRIRKVESNTRAFTMVTLGLLFGSFVEMCALDPPLNFQRQ